MKRNILTLSLFSLCCVGLVTTPSQAWFGLFSPWNGHHRYVTQITCRPYNAFTPICWGNLVCDGCCPNPCGVAAGCCMPPMCCGGMGLPYMGGSPFMGAPCMPMSMGGGSYGAGGCSASDMPIPAPMPMPDIRSQPSFNPPAPMPMPGPGVTMGNPQMPNGIAQANYYQNYYPATYPGYYPSYPAPMNYNPGYPYAPMPYYWYGYGR